MNKHKKQISTLIGILNEAITGESNDWSYHGRFSIDVDDTKVSDGGHETQRAHDHAENKPHSMKLLDGLLVATSVRVPRVDH